ncbi:MAG TPA: hypothetical protein VF548_11595 [Allosphingosinicella sp.]|jgi:hypothetical protein
MAWLPRFLFETESALPIYVAKAWLMALVPSIALSALVRQIATGAEAPQFPASPGLLVLLVVFVGPALETLLLAAPVLLLNRVAGPGPAVIASAVLWGIVHSLVVMTWGLVIWWPFLIMSIAFLTWRREGLVKALAAAFSIHALQNAFAVGLILMAS